VIKFRWWVFRASTQDWYILIIWVVAGSTDFAIKQSLNWGCLCFYMFEFASWKTFIYIEEVFLSQGMGAGKEFEAKFSIFFVFVICLYCINSTGQDLIWIFRGFQVFYTYFKCSSTLSNRTIFMHYFIQHFNIKFFRYMRQFFSFAKPLNLLKHPNKVGLLFH